METTSLSNSLNGVELFEHYNKGNFNIDINSMIDADSVYSLLRHIGSSKEQIREHAELLTKDLDLIISRVENLGFLGVSKKKVSTHLHLVKRDSMIIDNSYIILKNKGLTDSKIGSNPWLLGINQLNLLLKCSSLSNYGITDAKIASRVELLKRDTNTIKNNYDNLISLGISPIKIATQAQLLCKKQRTVKRNFNNLLKNLENDYDCDNNSDWVKRNAQLLGNSEETINENIDYFRKNNIDYKSNSLLLGTKLSLKLEKKELIRSSLENLSGLTIQSQKEVKTFDRYMAIHLNLFVNSFKKLENNYKTIAGSYKRFLDK